MAKAAKGGKGRGRPPKRTSDVPTGNGGLSTRQAPVDKIMRAKVSALTPYAKNPRLHSPEQVQQIANSMREFGQAQLVVVDEKGEIIAGHGRILAAEKLGWEHVMVGVAVGWTEAQRKAYRIADNQLGLTSRWDDQLLRGDVGGLKLADFDLSLLGFDPGMLQALSLEMGKGDNDLVELWQAMPEFDQNDERPYRSISIHFADQSAVDTFAKLLNLAITSDTRFAWFPKRDRHVFEKSYSS